MKTLVWVLVILNQGNVENEELVYPSLQKCAMYESAINRSVDKVTYNYSAYCRPTVVDKEEE
jgi:hypothetical protein